MRSDLKDYCKSIIEGAPISLDEFVYLVESTYCLGFSSYNYLNCFVKLVLKCELCWSYLESFDSFDDPSPITLD